MGGARGTAEKVGPEAPPKCDLCPRLVAYRHENEAAEPDWFNGAVSSFGPASTRFLIVGLAPGRNGANRTGRPFTGDYAGDLLFATLLEYGFAKGTYAARPDDGFVLKNCMISNSVRCVPPQNKPLPVEINTCRRYLEARIAALPNLEIMLALGRIAHDQALTTLGVRKALHPFAHGARHDLGPGPSGKSRVLYDSFHCSRYNTNTGRLTPDMFRSVFAAIKAELAAR